MTTERTWFPLDGGLEPLEGLEGAEVRFPPALAEAEILRHTRPGGWVLDPFAGFGTTLVAAQSLGRRALGFEVDAERCAFANARLSPPCEVLHDRIENLEAHDLPPFDLILTSPPYASFTSTANDPIEEYLPAFEAIFRRLAAQLAPGGSLVLEISNVRDDRGELPLAWHCGLALARILPFRGERIRCNTGGRPAGPGYDHSYVMHFGAEA